MPQRLAAAAAVPGIKIQGVFTPATKRSLKDGRFLVVPTMSVREPQGRQVGCEYFPRYGEDGHALAYFRNNPNLPDYIGGDLVASVRQTMVAAGLVIWLVASRRKT